MLNRGGMFRFGTSLFVSILCFAGTSAIAQGTGQPTDPQIAQIAYTAGQIDIRAAKQALGKSQKREELSTLSGAAFDMAYAENEVAYHQTVNGALEKTLIPSAQNEELKSLLQTGLKLFTEHEKHAENLVSELK